MKNLASHIADFDSECRSDQRSHLKTIQQDLPIDSYRKARTNSSIAAHVRAHITARCFLYVVALVSLLPLTNFSKAAPPILQSELLAPKTAILQNSLILTITSTTGGRAYQLQRSDSMAENSWTNLGCIVWGNGESLTLSDPIRPELDRRFYRITLDADPFALDGMYFITAGSFLMGDQSEPKVGYPPQEYPVHSVHLSAFLIGKYEVTRSLWRLIQSWGSSNGYVDLPFGEGKMDNHPVYGLTWYDAVKWCNARSEKEGLTPCYTIGGGIYRSGSHVPECNWDANGYRLPTEAEWEKAARGGLQGLNFPWGNTITHNQANYISSSDFSYDISSTRGNNPVFASDPIPYTSPVGTFPPNAYGIHDTVGNLFEWCWDYFDYKYYSTSPYVDPHGPDTDPDTDPDPTRFHLGPDIRSFRGGDWNNNARNARNSVRGRLVASSPGNPPSGIGLRLARNPIP